MRCSIPSIFIFICSTCHAISDIFRAWMVNFFWEQMSWRIKHWKAERFSSHFLFYNFRFLNIDLFTILNTEKVWRLSSHFLFAWLKQISYGYFYGWLSSVLFDPPGQHSSSSWVVKYYRKELKLIDQLAFDACDEIIVLLPITRIGRLVLILMDPSLNSLCSTGDDVLRNDDFW